MNNNQETNKKIINDLFDDESKSPAQGAFMPPIKEGNDNSGKVNPSFNLLASNVEQKNDSSDGESTPKQNQKKAFDFNKLNLPNSAHNEFDLFNNGNAPQAKPVSKYANLRETELFSGFDNKQKPNENKPEQNKVYTNKVNLQVNDKMPNAGMINQNINFDALFDNIQFKDDVKIDDKRLRELEEEQKKKKNNNNIINNISSGIGKTKLQNNQKKKNNLRIKLQDFNENDLFEDNYNDDYSNPKYDQGNYGNQPIQTGIDLEKISKYNQANGSVKTKATREYLSFKKNQFSTMTFYSSLTLPSINVDQSSSMPQIDPEVLSIQITADLEDILNNNNRLVNNITSQLSFDYSSTQFSPIGPCISWNEDNSSFSSDLHSIREVLSDGDGFFRAFMFSLGEQLINEGNLYELKKIANSLFINIDKPFVYRDAEIDKNEILIIFSFIFNALESKNKKEANDYWMKSFIKNKNFSYGMIKYAKLMLGSYIQQHGDQLNTEELIINKIINPNYVFNKKLRLNDYFEEKVFRMNSDDEALLIYLTPIVFNISLIIYSRENNEKKVVFPALVNDNKHSYPITLMFNEFKYWVVNTKDYFNKNSSSILYVNLGQVKKSRMSLFCENSKCEVCLTTSEEILFEQMANTPFCKNCLVTALNKVISTRISCIINEDYANIQYYLRPIALSSNHEEVISNEDMKELTGSSILEHILFLIKNTCLICNTAITGNDMFITMPCECKVCKNCAGGFVLKDTDDKVILNVFEKRFLKIKPSMCACGIPFDCEYAIQSLYCETELNAQKEKSQQRLENYSKRFCILCKESQKHNPINMKGNEVYAREYYIMIPVNQDESNPVNTEHIMCKSCTYVFKGKINEMMKNGSIDKKAEDVPILCSVCGKDHLIKLKAFKSSSKENEVTCCLIY